MVASLCALWSTYIHSANATCDTCYVCNFEAVKIGQRRQTGFCQSKYTISNTDTRTARESEIFSFPGAGYKYREAIRRSYRNLKKISFPTHPVPDFGTLLTPRAADHGTAPCTHHGQHKSATTQAGATIQVGAATKAATAQPRGALADPRQNAVDRLHHGSHWHHYNWHDSDNSLASWQLAARTNPSRNV